MRKRIIAFILILVFMIISIIAVLERGRVQAYVVDFVTNKIESMTGCKVELTDIAFSYPLNLNIGHVTISENGLELVDIHQLSLTISPLQLMQSKLVFKTLYAEEVHFKAISPETPLEISWKLVPGYLKFKQLEIKQFSISASVLKQLEQNEFLSLADTPLHVKGLAAFDEKSRYMFIDFLFGKDLQLNPSHFVTSITQLNGLLKTQIRIAESGQGLIAKHMNLPSQYNYQTIVDAEGFITGTLSGDFQFTYSSADENPNDYFGKYGSLKGPFLWSAIKGLHIQHLEGIAGNILISGVANLSPQMDIDGSKLKLSMHDTSKLSNFNIASGPIQVELELSSKLPSPHIELKAQASKFQFSQQLIGDLSIQTHVLYDPILHFLSLTHIDGQLGASHLAGELSIDLQEKMLKGELTGNTDLSSFMENAKNTIFGFATFVARFQYDNQLKQLIDVSLRAPRLYSGKFIAERADIHIALQNAFKTPKGTLKFTCNRATYEDLKTSNLVIDTEINDEKTQWPFTLSCRGETLQINSSGLWHIANHELQVSMDMLKGTIGKYPFELKKNLLFEIDANHVVLSPSYMNIGPGTLYAILNNSPDQFGASFQLRNIPLDLFKLVYPHLPIDGSTNAQIELKQTEKSITGQLQVEINDLDLLQHSFIANPIHASFNAVLDGKDLTCQGYAKGLGPQPIEFTAEVPVEASLYPPLFEIDSKRDLHAHFFMESQIESLLELFMPSTATTLTGTGKIALEVTGTTQAPQFNGTLDLSNGTFEILDVGISLSDVKMHANLTGQEIVLTNISGNGKDSGTVTGKGSIQLNAAAGYPFAIELAPQQLSFIPFSIATATGTGQLTFKGNNQEAAIQGKIQTDSLSVAVPDQINKSIQTVDVTYINQPYDKALPTGYPSTHSNWPLHFNIDFDIPKNGHISGKDWSSTWRGDLKLGGTTDAVLVDGALHIVKGQYRFNGKSFEIEEGILSFTGDPDETTLYVIASKDLSEIKADIILKGPLKKPAISFRSNPPLPQREILSWILFNRGSSDITTFQGTQLNDSISDLETSGKPDVFTQIRDSIGIDRIDIDRGENGTSNEVSVQVGKYISQGVYVSVSKSVTAEANRLAIEADVVKNVKVQAEVGDDAEGLLLLKWKRDY